MYYLSFVNAYYEYMNSDGKDALGCDMKQHAFSIYKKWKAAKAEFEEASKIMDQDDNLRFICNLAVKSCEDLEAAENERATLGDGPGSSGEEGGGEVSGSSVGARRESEVESELEHESSD